MAIKTKKLNEKQEKILTFLEKYQSAFDNPPSIREIGDGTGISSTFVINYYLDQLERLGYIERKKRTTWGLALSEIPYKRLLRTFLCHSSTDKQAVLKLYKKLVSDGVDAWLDKEKILPGQNWELEMKNALFDADIIIVCLSKESISKEGFVQKEIKFALDKADEKPEETIYIIPARLEECDVPSRLSKWQWVDLFESEGYSKLLQSLKKRSKDIK